MNRKREAARREAVAARSRAAAEAEREAARREAVAAHARAAAEAEQSRARAAAEAGAARVRAAAAAEVVPWLRALGLRADEARRAAARCEAIPDAPLEERVRCVLSGFGGPRAGAPRRVSP